ncbi:KH domain-containing protein [Aerococcus kribbianus]|uniref:RNA-binding protein KhpA n=1 Tax=Aerococcus kribbianus TaxID=2999064 RepID=A0A9X3JGD9_9LACT|nr:MULTISPECIES: KH domain-containing protein [unclassified Aerococcus]MCZ0717141.1 KH domain-containing protein [Aerococcus sp. YH-aer221]MCZ0725429.1 KH domain-containing protein [Aerococcus sp. YH-aer222]
MPDIKQLLLTMVEPLIQHQDELELQIVDGEEFLEYHLLLHPDDVGRVIGKGGRVANALRTILYSVRVDGPKRIRLVIDNKAEMD